MKVEVGDLLIYKSVSYYIQYWVIKVGLRGHVILINTKSVIIQEDEHICVNWDTPTFISKAFKGYERLL